jgi:hypothetical protein
LHITLERFPQAFEFLQQRKESIRALGICDIRDVLVQENPFMGLGKAVVTGEEGEVMERCRTNADWYQQLYGREALAKVAASRILCSGVVLGQSVPMAAYLKAMAVEIGAKLTQIGERGYFDQAIHNRVLRSGEVNFEASPVSGGRISTLGYPGGSHVAWEVGRRSVLVDGVRPPVVHQYDRVLKT